MANTSFDAVVGSSTPTKKVGHGARCRWLALAGFAATVVFLGWTFVWIAQQRGFMESDIPLFLGGSVVGFATATLAAFGLRGAGRAVRVGLILMGLFAVCSAGWNVFIAGMIVLFPRC